MLLCVLDSAREAAARVGNARTSGHPCVQCGRPMAVVVLVGHELEKDQL